jgi:hypothetical protein
MNVCTAITVITSQAEGPKRGGYGEGVEPKWESERDQLPNHAPERMETLGSASLLTTAVCIVGRVLVAVTDHAAERFRQRVRGSLDEKTEIAARVARAYAADRVEEGERGAVLVRDLKRPDVVYVCRREGDELLVVTLWEEGEEPLVPRRFTNALRRDDHLVN